MLQITTECSTSGYLVYKFTIAFLVFPLNEEKEYMLIRIHTEKKLSLKDL